MVSSVKSMKLGILRIDPRLGYFPEVGIRISLRLLYILGYIFQSDRCLVFGILNYWSSLFMVSIIRLRSKIMQQEVQRMSIF